MVGFIVRRPDLLWMFKRSDRFIALDAIEVRDGVICPVKGMDSWDDRAIKRMGVDWDTCIIWEGMPVRTSSGEDLGRVDDISFDEETGEAESLFLDDGGTARALVGSVEIPKELMVGYDDGLLIVKSEAAQCKEQAALRPRPARQPPRWASPPARAHTRPARRWARQSTRAAMAWVRPSGASSAR